MSRESSEKRLHFFLRGNRYFFLGLIGHLSFDMGPTKTMTQHRRACTNNAVVGDVVS